MKINRGIQIIIGLFTCACVLSNAPAIRASGVYLVTVNTSSLIGNVNAPYYVDFQLNSGGGPFANTATVNNFNFGGGSPSPFGSAIVYLGTGASGDLSTGFSLTCVPGTTSTSAFNEIAQQFNPGSTLSFDVTLTDNAGVHAPDAFVFSIDDNSTYQIPTTDPNGGLSLATISINNIAQTPPAISVAVFSPTDPQYSGMIVSVTPVPEPSAAALSFVALNLVGGISLFRTHKRMK